MRYALYLPNFGEFADVRALADLALEAEQAGWDGFFLWDHIQFGRGTLAADPWVALTSTLYIFWGKGIKKPLL